MAVSYLINAVFVVRNALQFNSIRFGIHYKLNESRKKGTAQQIIKYTHTHHTANDKPPQIKMNVMVINLTQTHAHDMCVCVLYVSYWRKSENNGKIVCEIFRS